MTKPIARDPNYRGPRFEAEIIELCVRWYITYRLSYRDLVAMMAERGLAMSYTTILRWVNSLTPQAAAALIRERTQHAIEQRAKYAALRLQGPVEVELSFSNRRHADLLAMLPMFERSDAHSVRFRAKDMLEASRVVEFIFEYDQDFGG